ncbi:MAG: hypothetical protein P8078_12725 [bacterium]
MAKTKSFADKVAKHADDKTLHCSTCGETLKEIKLVKSIYSEKTKSWRFKTKLVEMCKCNKNEIMK